MGLKASSILWSKPLSWDKANIGKNRIDITESAKLKTLCFIITSQKILLR